MKKIKYSIITANYNGFNRMDDYFASLEKQTYKNFEVIIVDDCSTDDSYKKLFEFSKKTKLNIQVKKTPVNSGPGVARNIGIKNSSGDYITFIDNDDWVEPNLFEKINNIIENEQFDCIIYDYYINNQKTQTEHKSVYNGTEGIMTKSNAIKYIRNHTVCKFYRNEIIKKHKLEFPAIRRHEDVAFVGSVLVNCSSFYYLPECLYHYVQYENSLSTSKSYNGDTLNEAFSILKNNFNGKYSKELAEKSVTDLLYGSILIMCKRNTPRKKVIEFIDKYNDEYPEWYKSEIINYVGKGKKLFFFFIKNKMIFMLKILAKIHTLILK